MVREEQALQLGSTSSPMGVLHKTRKTLERSRFTQPIAQLFLLYASFTSSVSQLQREIELVPDLSSLR